ncbi:hypothetical protein [Kerstersia gyiorum]|jgi:cyd operon protein YbgT|uniref:Cyd operon protein YbgT n=1 Tax=Kerstersia gyiorum TaxID=206506 RepID=A0A171KUP8_9BURK|nr:hypothetical protein [Kerstersia gyiorum]AZV93218.1 hypothetical protein CBF45_05395 [Bordetella sp. J329]KAB0543592.1 hypothetical protein F7P85_06910 [Kerstersia gyiorum]KKO72615.1 hypothetical protein AAV32_06240 [Kerstersia gyiorum]MCH4271469.1 hypothetical protein [Kerstersia gyiorum]MCI1228102.1 hypothetical protein [Kerstersia gyiorum]
MSVLARFIVAGVLAVIVILLAIVLGDYGPWYFSWLLGTGFMILVAALGGVLFEAQEEAAESGASGKAKVAKETSGY